MLSVEVVIALGLAPSAGQPGQAPVGPARGGGATTLQGPVTSSDLFYDENENWKLWAKYGVLGIEMEAAELYTLAAKFDRKALAILTVSDHIATGEATTAEERQTTFTNMIQIALEAGISC